MFVYHKYTYFHFVLILMVLSFIITFSFQGLTLINQEEDCKVDIKDNSDIYMTNIISSYDIGSLDELLILNEKNIDIGIASIIIDKGYDPNIALVDEIVKIDKMAEKLLDDMPDDVTPIDVISKLNKILFDTMHFKVVEGEIDPKDGFLTNVLKSKSGNCLGLCVLYVSIGRRVGLPLSLIWVPGNVNVSNHVFVRYSEGKSLLNIEATENGKLTDNNYYYVKFKINKDKHELRKLNILEEMSLVLYNRGRLWMRTENYKNAIDDFSKSIELDPLNYKAYSNRGDAWNKIKEYDNAIKDCNESINIEPSDISAYITRGISFYNIEKYDAALADFTKVIEKNPKLDIPFFMRGSIWHVKGNNEKAISDYSMSIKINKNYFEAYKCRGALYFQKGEIDLSIEDYNRAIKLNPKDSNAYSSRGALWYAKKEYKKAINDFTMAIDFSPNDLNALASRATVLLKLCKYEEAIRDFSTIINNDSDNVNALENRAKTYYFQKKYNRAWDDVKTIQRLGKNVDKDLLDRLSSLHEGKK